MDNATKVISYIYSIWDSYFGQVTFTGLGSGIDQTLIATLVFLVVSLLLIKLFRKVNDKIKNLRDRAEFTLKIGELTLISAAGLSEFLLVLFRFVRAVFLVFLFFCYLTLITGFFKATRGLATAGLRWLFSSMAQLGGLVWACVPGFVAIFFIAFITMQILKLLHLIMGAVERGSISLPWFHRDWASPTDKLISFLLVALAVVLGAPFLPGFDTPAFQGVSVFLGLLLSLGSTAAVANVVAGVTLIYMRACRPGDRVKIGEIEGIVLETGLLVTRIKTMENRVITMPNGLMLSQPIINLTSLAQAEGVGMSVDLTLGYDLDWRMVHKLLLAAAGKTEGLAGHPAAFVLQSELGDFSVAYRLQAFTRDPVNLPRIHSNLRANVLDTFAEAGVEILSPVYEANREGTGPVIPQKQPDK